MIRNQNISEEEFEIIERYILNEMSPEERDAFELQIIKDDEMKNKVNEMRLLLLSINEASIAEKLNTYHSDLSVLNKNKKTNSANVISMRRWLMAASVILIIGFATWLLAGKLNRNDRTFSEFYKPDPGLISAMSTSDNYNFDRAMIDYKTGNYDAAIKAWESMLAIHSANDTLNYFVGSAYLAAGKNEKAIEHFKKVISVANSYFLKDAYWYLGLALLKEGRREEAISFIEKSDHQNKATLLLSLKE